MGAGRGGHGARNHSSGILSSSAIATRDGCRVDARPWLSRSGSGLVHRSSLPASGHGETWLAARLQGGVKLAQDPVLRSIAAHLA